jgi:hypothetical protein
MVMVVEVVMVEHGAQLGQLAIMLVEVVNHQAQVVLVVKLLVVLAHILLGQEQEQDMGVLANVNLPNT